MTIPIQTPIVAYTADGIATVFPFPFKVVSVDDLVVEINNLPAATSYTVDGIGDDEGTVTFATPPVAASAVLIYRDTALKRDYDYQNNGDFRSDTVNADIDRPWAALQEQNQRQKQALTIPFESAGQGTVLPLAPVRGGKPLVFDAAGNASTGDQDYVEPQTALDNAKHVAEQLVAAVAPGAGTGMFLQDGVGAQVRTFQDKMRDSVNLMDVFPLGTPRASLATMNCMPYLQQAAAIARTAGKKLVIDCACRIDQTVSTDSLRLLDGDHIAWEGAGQLIQSNFGIPVIYAAGAVRWKLDSPYITFAGTIPAAVPAVTGIFKTALVAILGADANQLPPSEIACALGIWATKYGRIRDARMGSANVSLLNLMHVAIDTWRNYDLEITNAKFDGICMGIVGSGNDTITIDASCRNRGNLDQTVYPWSAPSHVVYLSPTGTGTAPISKARLNIIEDESEVAGSYVNGATTVKIGDSQLSVVTVRSRFPQGGLTMAGVSNSDIFLQHTGLDASRMLGSAPIRVLEGTIGTLATENVRLIVIAVLPTGWLAAGGYVDMGQFSASGTVGFTGGELSMSIYSAEATFGSIGIVQLRGYAGTLRLKYRLPNLTGGTPVLLNINTPGAGARAEIDFAPGASYTGWPSVRIDGGQNMSVMRNTITGETAEFNNLTTLRTKFLNVSLTPAAGSNTASIANFIPVGYAVIGMATGITTAFNTGSGLTGFQIGDGVDADRFGVRTGVGSGGLTNNLNWTDGTIKSETANRSLVLTAVGGTFDGVGTVRINAVIRTNV